MKTVQELMELLGAGVNPKSVEKEFYYYCNQQPTDINGLLTLIENSTDEEFKAFWYDICLLWIAKCHKYLLKDYFDDRNAQSVKIGDMLYDILFDEVQEACKKYNYNGWVLDNYDYEEEMDAHENPIHFSVIFVESMGREHRTIQQTFSKVIYWYLGRNYEHILSGKIKDAFWRLPTI